MRYFYTLANILCGISMRRVSSGDPAWVVVVRLCSIPSVSPADMTEGYLGRLARRANDV